MTGSPASPNCGPRRNGARPELIVLHYTGMASSALARARLCDPSAEVSAHWLIAEDGTTEALVPEDLRAWHAGAGSWAGLEDVNSRSIGIELANPGDQPFAERQMAALEQVLAGIMQRWDILPQSVIAHSDMAPGRKADPGPRFDWARLARQGLAVAPEPGGRVPPVDAASFTAMATTFGYPEVPLAVLLPAVRLRLRPRHDGPLDAQDMALITDLALRFGADGGAWRSS